MTSASFRSPRLRSPPEKKKEKFSRAVVGVVNRALGRGCPRSVGKPDFLVDNRALGRGCPQGTAGGGQGLCHRPAPSTALPRGARPLLPTNSAEEPPKRRPSGSIHSAQTSAASSATRDPDSQRRPRPAESSHRWARPDLLRSYAAFARCTRRFSPTRS